MKKYRYTGPVEKRALLKFIEDWKSGALVNYYKSEGLEAVR